MSARAARFARLPRFEGAWLTWHVSLPESCIQLLCAQIEAHDNLAIVRTPEPKGPRVAVYACEGVRGEVDRMLADLGTEIPMRVESVERGLGGLDSFWAAP